MVVKFYNEIEDNLMKFAVIISRYKGKWVFCKHKARNAKTAKRELMEETGAYKFFIKPICVYSVTGKNKVNMSGKETFGMLFLADIFEFSESLTHEIELVKLFDELPENWTYPEIQPYLIREYQKREKSS